MTTALILPGDFKMISDVFPTQYAEARCYFKFKKISIKQAFFITDIFPSRVKASKQKKNPCFFLLVLVFFSKLVIFKTFLNNKISKFCL